MPKISVIVPIYNAENFLERCIDSLLAQTIEDFELILVNDGSTDSSKRICERYKSKDERIILINQQNSGPSTSRNSGLNIAKGEFICFVDADDYVGKEYLSCMLNKIDEETDLIFQGMICIKQGKQSMICFKNEEVFFLDNKCTFFDKYILFRYCGSYCKLFRNKILNEFNIRFSSDIIYAEDYDFILNYLKYCRTIKVVPNAHYYYEGHENSISTRIYKFDEEYSGLCRLYKSVNQFEQLENIVSFSEQKHQLITYYIQRVIFSNYRNNYNRKKRIDNFYLVDEKFISYFDEYHTPETRFLKLVKFLFINKQFHILDFIMNIATRR